MNLIAQDLTRSFHGRFGDEYGPEIVVGVFDKDNGKFHGGVVCDNSSLSLQNGGTKVWNGGIREIINPNWLRQSPLEVLNMIQVNLARPMTIKHFWCYPKSEKLPFSRPGGGKGGWILGEYSGQRDEFICQWARALSEFTVRVGGRKRSLLGDAFIGGADSGVSEKDLALICRATGNFKCVTGGPGFIQYESIGATGWVLLHAAKVLVEYLYDLDPVRNHSWGNQISISLSGFGQVGVGFVQHMPDQSYEGPTLVAVSNKATPEGEAIRSIFGLNVPTLLSTISRGQSILSLADGVRVKRTQLGCELYELATILVLAANVEPMIDDRNAHRIRASIVLSGTNSGISDAGYGRLYERKTLAPLDATVNIGAASVAWSSFQGLKNGACVQLALRAVEENLLWLLANSKTRGLRMDELARKEVLANLVPIYP